MATPNGKQVGIEFLLMLGGTLLGGTTSATRSFTQNLTGATHKGSGRWSESVANQREWELSFEGMALVNGVARDGLQASLAVQTGVNADGTPTWTDLSQRTSLSMELSMETADVSNADSGRWRELRPSTRSYTMSPEGNFVDPESASGEALAQLRADRRAGDSSNVQLSFHGCMFEGQVFMGSDEKETPIEDRAAQSLELTGTGPLVGSYDVTDPGLAGLLDAFFATGRDQQVLTALMKVTDEGQNNVTGATQEEGLVIPTSLSIELPFDGRAGASGTLTGTGPITASAQA